MRSLPHGSVPPSATWPVSSIGLVMPLIVISPVRRSLPSAAESPAVEWKLICGCCSTSKNSGEVRCVSRFSSPVSMLLTSTLPDSDGRVAGGVDGALELAELAADGRDAHVTDLEADARMRGVDGVGAGGDRFD